MRAGLAATNAERAGAFRRGKRWYYSGHRLSEIPLRSIVAAIWEHNTQFGLRHNVSVSRIYRDEGEDWSRSTSFGRDDLLAKVLDLAHTWIFDQAQGSSDEPRSEEGDGEVPY